MGEDKECLGAVLTISDITTMKTLDRLKSEFVAEVSHELRSPLSTIHEQLAMVISDMTEQKISKDVKILARALEKTHGLISLVGDLLDLSRIEEGSAYQEKKPVHLEETLKNIVEFLTIKAKANQNNLTLRLPRERLPVIICDPLALESIFGNLVANAINYTQKGGNIRVEAHADSEGIIVSVADDGMGIEKRNLERIFKRFYRVRNEKTRHIIGTGLGLPIVKELVDRMGGNICVKTKPGNGSTFTVFLPSVLKG